VHARSRITGLMQPRAPEARAAYYLRWNNLRWRWLLRCFFSRGAMGRLGRDPAFFAFAEGDLPAHIAARTRQALVAQDPSANPYLAWILTGTHGAALPLALREEHFTTIRDRLDRVECRRGALDNVLPAGLQADGWNLSDIFEYMSPAEHLAAYRHILDATSPGGRLVYWNMLTPRACPDSLAPNVLCHDTASLHSEDKAFFYRALRIEERRA
jgi:S-adenosylmethionine-diacylglycerol 3-amino-3-carboxypropyl transferase